MKDIILVYIMYPLALFGRGKYQIATAMALISHPVTYPVRITLSAGIKLSVSSRQMVILKSTSSPVDNLN